MSSAEIVDITLQNVSLIQSLVGTDGSLESPIDLDLSRMTVIELPPLEWTGIEIPPRKLKITNTGYTVILSAKWQHERPYITGGPIAGNYIFGQIHFHWGEDEMNGSEHTVDGSRLPMEVHVVHFKDEYETLESALRRPGGVTILVYFCKLQEEPNEFMQEIVRNLPVIRTAHSSVRIVPSSLSTFIKPFTNDYFVYWGSIITIHNMHSILWIICREPIGLTMGQIAEFRNLTNEREAPMLTNVRQLKDRKGRDIFHVHPSGSTYASLLPIPRAEQRRQTDATAGLKNISAA